MNIIFKNNGTLSLLDLTTMGDSIKRGDESKIGKFDSGLKYALAILYRNGIEVDIYSGDSHFTLGSRIIKDELTNKVKELLVINERRDKKKFDHITAFSPQLGHEWKVWMAIRELFSNCMDEDGKIYFAETYDSLITNSEVLIIVKDNGLLSPIIENWDDYFLPTLIPCIYSNGYINIYPNTKEYLRLYKRGILIFEDKNVKSKYVYDYCNASIDEMRLLNDKISFIGQIEYTIESCVDENFIYNFLLHSETNLFESNLSYSNLNKKWIEIANKIYNECYEEGKVFCPFPGIYKALISHHDANLGIKTIRYNSPSYYWSETKVEIPKTSEDKILSFQDIINNICKENFFEIKYPIVEAKMDRFTCLPDIYKKIIYVSDQFSKDNLWEMVKAQVRIEGNDDPDYIFKKYVEILH